MSTNAVRSWIVLGSTFFAGCVGAEPVSYDIDPGHTYPSIEVDHMGLSTFRGKFTSTDGTIVMDREAQTGTVDITIHTASVDFGHDKFNDHVKKQEMLNVEQFPTATYKGTLVAFQNGAPTRIEGTFTLRGVSKPLVLSIDRFTCRPHPISKKPVCGADASGEFNREDFGIAYGKDLGFGMNTKIAVQIEAYEAS